MELSPPSSPLNPTRNTAEGITRRARHQARSRQRPVSISPNPPKAYALKPPQAQSSRDALAIAEPKIKPHKPIKNPAKADTKAG